MTRLALAALTAAAACSTRPHVGTDRDKARDGSPSVVYVDHGAGKANPQRPVVTPKVPLVDEAEPNDEIARAQPLEYPKGVKGTISAPREGQRGDQDVYSWLVATGPAGARDGGGGDVAVARVELGGVPGLALALEVLDGDGKKLAAASDAAVGEAQVLPNLFVQVGRTYYLRVKETGKPRGDASHPYTLVASLASLEAGDEIEPNDTPETATPIAPATPSSGFFGRRRDEDWLRLGPDSAAPGAMMRLELSSVEGVTPLLRVADAQGKTLVEARGGKGDPLLLRNAPAPGDGGGLLLLRAESGRSTDLRWTLRAVVEPALPGFEVEPNDTAERATPLPVLSGGEPMHGYLWPGDVDLYRVHADAAGIVRVELTPPDGERVDLKLEIFAPASLGKGKPLLKIDDAGSGKPELMPDWFVVEGGEVLLRVTGRAHDTAFSGPYALAVKRVAEERPTEHEPNDSALLAHRIVAGQPVEAWLAPKGDEDWFAFTPAGPARLHAALAAAPPGTTPRLRVLDEKNAQLASASGTSIDADVEGPVFIVVKDGAGRSSATSYNLTVTVVEKQ